MGDALTELVVHRNEAPFRFHRERNGFRHQLHVFEECRHLVAGKIRQCRDVIPGHEQNVTRKERACVEKGEAGVVLEDKMRRARLTDDVAEYAFRHNIPWCDMLPYRTREVEEWKY